MKLNHVTLFVSNLARSTSFYERLGLETIVYAPPRYARLVFPDMQTTLSVEVVDGPKRGSDGALIYVDCGPKLKEIHGRFERAQVQFVQPPTDMSYLWREAWLRDPDGHEIRLYDAGVNRLDPPWRLRTHERRALTNDLQPASYGSRTSVEIAIWRKARRELLPLFELADDSLMQIAEYIDEGEVLVARPGAPVGHLQLVAGTHEREFEIKSLAVAEDRQRSGIATCLVKAAIERCRDEGARLLSVKTAASSLGALRFYLNCGFRVSGVVRDAFTSASGYSDGLLIDGLPLNDALVLTMGIEATPPNEDAS